MHTHTHTHCLGFPIEKAVLALCTVYLCCEVNTYCKSTFQQVLCFMLRLNRYICEIDSIFALSFTSDLPVSWQSVPSYKQQCFFLPQVKVTKHSVFFQNILDCKNIKSIKFREVKLHFRVAYYCKAFIIVHKPHGACMIFVNLFSHFL